MKFFYEFPFLLAGSLSLLPKNGNLEVSLTTLRCEIYTISPIGVSNLRASVSL